MVQAAAASCALNQEIETVQQRVYKRLEELVTKSLSQSQPEVRWEIAHILEHVRPSAALEQLCQRLLSDPSPEVRKAVLHSIAQTRPPGVVSALIEALRDSSLRSEVRTALSSYGESLFPHLRKVLEDEEGLLEQKKWALKIAADIGGPQALELLVAMAHGADLILRFAAIKALNRLKKHQSLESAHPALESLLGQEIHTLEIEVQRARSFSPQPRGLMEAVLNQRQVWARERIFRVLGLLYEPDRIYRAYLALIGGNRHRADAALELLDTILSPSHRHRILPLLESHRRAEMGTYTRSAHKAVLLSYLRERDPLPAAAGIADLSAKELSLWRVEIREALEALQEAESREQGTESERHTPCSPFHALSDLSLVEETLNWRYAQMEAPPKLQETKYRQPAGSSALTTLQKLENLGKVDIFSRLGPYELLVLANQSIEVEFQPGQSIFVEGEIAQEIFSLVSGSVELRRASGYVELVKPGESFGTLAVLTHQPRLFSARALEHCLCLKLDRESFWEILEDYPAVCQGIFEVLVHRIQTLIDRSGENMSL